MPVLFGFVLASRGLRKACALLAVRSGRTCAAVDQPGNTNVNDPLSFALLRRSRA